MKRIDYPGLTSGSPAAVELRRGEKRARGAQDLIHTPSVFTEFLSAHGQPISKTQCAQSRRPGWPVVWSGGEGYGVRFAYVEPPNGPAAVIEISELTDATAANVVFMHDAAAEWDGSEPIWVLGA
jgi:hypothetical protein